MQTTGTGSRAFARGPRQVLVAGIGLVLAALATGSVARAGTTIIDIAIVEALGRPGHVGFFPIQGAPIVGSIATVRARLAGAANSVALDIRDSGGALIGQIPMTAPPADTWPSGTYFAEFQVPTVPFALSVSGTDAGGNSFELTPPQATAISPQTLAVRLIPTVAELPAGIPIYVTVQATNYAAPDSFGISLASDVGATIVPASTSLSLATNQTAGAQFQLTIPASLSGAFTVKLTATATSSAPAGSTNNAVLELPIATQPAAPLTAWIRPDDKRDLVELDHAGDDREHDRAGDRDRDRDSFIDVWVCDTGVNGNSVNIANALPPVRVRHLEVPPGKRKACSAPSAFELTFNATDLVAVLSTTGLSPQKHREIQLPLTGYRPDGTPLIGYVPLLF